MRGRRRYHTETATSWYLLGIAVLVIVCAPIALGCHYLVGAARAMKRGRRGNG